MANFGKRILLAGLVLTLGTSLASQERANAEYKIGPQDLLEITVLGAQEFNKLQVRVSENGDMTLPLLGTVAVNNLTKSEFETKLADLLGAKYLLNPQVSVFILEYRSKRVSVIGAVEKAGPYELLGPLTLLDIISEAGGLSADAAKEIIVIRKLPGGGNTALHISIEELFYLGDAKLNIPLEPGDVINIPVDKIVMIYVWGQVKSPGALEVKKSSIPTLTQAIAQAGGFTSRAAKGSVKIRRKDASGKEQEIKVNVKDILKGAIKDIQLEENDTVYVSETIF
jgi:polysaccharide export outer membrane protein